MKQVILIATYFSLLIALIWLQACATTDKLPNKTFHNITAKYNPYFLARKRIDSVETAIFEKKIDNYNRVLEVIPFPDTSALKGYDAVMNKAIKQAAIVPNRHENSKLMDASYILVGKARFYLREYDNSLNTFKYVNTKAKDENDKNWALIELLFIYTQLKDEKSAKSVLNLLSKKEIGKREKKNFYLNRGHYFRTQSDWIETAKSLGSAVLVMPKGEKRARIYFILGQIYQKLERNTLAYKNYRSVLKNNPPYELAFYAKLYGNQVVGSGEKNDIQKTKRYFNKLLADFKNKEYKDKIYYEMAVFELNQKNVPLAINHLRESVDVSTQNPIQKAYSYAKLGEVHYANLQDYELAKVYYDSALTTMPQEAEEFKMIEKRKKTLDKFVKYLTDYRTQDSLQRLAQMQEPALSEYLTKMLTFDEIRKAKIEDSLAFRAAVKAKQKEKEQKGTLAEATPQGNNTWYFNNPAIVQKGQLEFAKIWGQRPLEDNWRRASKVSATTSTQEVTAYEIVNPDEIRQQAIKRNVEDRKKQVLDLIPKSDTALAASNKLIENACYEIGKLYRFNLEEPQNAIKYFELLLGRFPNTEYEPEVLYALYQLNQDLKEKVNEEIYKQKLLSKFPNSLYARLIANPDYLKEAKSDEVIVKAAYQKAYGFYEVGRNEEAIAVLDKVIKDFPKNLLEDKLDLLKLLCQFKIDRNKPEFKKALEAFRVKYPQSELSGYAEGLVKEMK